MDVAVKQEAELYGPVKSFFEQRGFEVKSEILHCDLVAIRPDDGKMLIVEMKKTFNLALLLQGVERLRICGHVVLAVERNRKKSGAHNQRFGDLSELCRMLGIGLMTVTFFKTKPPLVEMLCEPGDYPRKSRRPTRQTKIIDEFKERSGDYNVGGVSRRKLVTAYREKALQCAWTLQQHGRLAPRQIAEITGNRRAAELLRKDYYGWFERVARGIYDLRPAGLAALEHYAEVVAAWQASVANMKEAD